MDLSMIKYNEQGLVPAIAQDISTKAVLMLAYMNEEALEKTLTTGKAHYYSRSRNKLWLKGEQSGHFQYVKSVKYDCDADTLLISVEQVDNACHTGEYSCFHNSLLEDNATQQKRAEVLYELYNVVVDRKNNPKEGSYTNFLLTKGVDKIAKKVAEEACEVVIAAKNASKEEITYETADLLYHLIVLLADNDISLNEIFSELEKRR